MNQIDEKTTSLSRSYIIKLSIILAGDISGFRSIII